MKKEQLLKTLSLIKEYNEDLFSKLRVANRAIKGENRKKKDISVEDLQEILILISILLSGNIKARYELEEYLKENKAFMELSALKTITTNCKQDIDALKSVSFNMVEVLKSIRHKEEDEKYKEKTV